MSRGRVSLNSVFESTATIKKAGEDCEIKVHLYFNPERKMWYAKEMDVHGITDTIVGKGESITALRENLPSLGALVELVTA